MASELLAVTGSPILHSRSPNLFHHGFCALGLEGYYMRLSAKTASEALSLAHEMRLGSMNVTSPHKQDMADLVECVDEASKKLGAVNTLVRGDNVWLGYNTDPQGVLGALSRHGFDARGAQVLVLGAGGAARAAMYALVNAGADVYVANRTEAKARKWSEKLGCKAWDMSGLKERVRSSDLLVSCLPTGARLIEADWLRPETLVMDADYSQAWLAKRAQDRGCETIDGKHWLIYQALAGFKLMVGKDVEYAHMHEALFEKPVENTENILMVGFMGSGKSSVGRILARSLGMEFVDTDEVIQERAGVAVSEIFRTRGEDAFRQLEQTVLGEVLEHKGQVVSCGGGAVLSAGNRDLLRSSGIVIWLWAPLDVCLKRANDDSRPLLSGPDSHTKARELFDYRLDLYAACSHMVVTSDGFEPAEIAGVVADEVRGILKD